MVNTVSSICRLYSWLPVSSVVPELLSSLTDNHCVLSAPTGSGKTTLIPLALLDVGLVSARKIIMLEPRRIAARTAAVRMSAMLDEPVGTTVGYRTRFDSAVSHSTRIEVVTEGIFIRMLQHDPELIDTGLIIFDEFHERSLQADLGLALTLDLCELRDDLKVLVMSATLESEKIRNLLDNAPLIVSEGKSHPIDISYLPPRKPGPSTVDQMIHGISLAMTTTQGDILAFLPGAGEIRQCQKILGRDLSDTEILPLYGSLSHQMQDRVFSNPSAKRRIILATPIAETSITIEGISCVVDSGLFRHPVHDQASGLSRLTTSRISRASASQRAGRAGRLGPGHCFRLWSKEVEHSLLEHTPPEILHSDLTDLVLQLALWGVTDPGQLRWLDPPRKPAWNSAADLLKLLGLIDDTGRITNSGKVVADLALHPRLGIILIHSKEMNMLWTGCLLAAVLTDRDILPHLRHGADIESRIRVLSHLDQSAQAPPPDVDQKLCRRLLKQAGDWFQKLKTKHDKKTVHYGELGNLLAFGYPDRIAGLRRGSNCSYQLANGRGAELIPADLLSGTPFIVATHVDARQKNGRIFLAATISEDDLFRHHGHALTRYDNISWNDEFDRVDSTSELRAGKLVLKSKSLDQPDQDQVTAAFLDGVRRNGIDRLPWSRPAREIQARISFLHNRFPDNWPDVSDKALIHVDQWLAPYCQNMHRLEHLNELNLKTILLAMLNWERQVQLDTLAPTHITVPSGSKIKLAYDPAEPPVLAVRLQELFGLLETPRICNNEVPVQLHLLSPAGRPVQVTADLHSFWHNTYPEVRKELAGRYPKHYWPEDPLVAKPTAKTKKQMQNSGTPSKTRNPDRGSGS